MFLKLFNFSLHPPISAQTAKCAYHAPLISKCSSYFQVAQWFELVVFTASMEIYGQAVADKLDSNQGMLNRRYYRQHCTLDFGSYTKDLSAICADLSSVFILDNSPGAYRSYPGY